MSTTYKRLQKILMQEYSIPQDKLSLTTELKELDIDSLGTMELLFKLEDEFHIRLPLDSTPLLTMEDIVGHVDTLISQQRHIQLPTADIPSVT